MSLLLVHSHKFRVINNKYYSPGGLNNEILTRYTSLFGNVTVLCRIISEDIESEKFSKITNPSVTFEDYRSFSINELRTIVCKHDFFIARVPSGIGYICSLISILMRKSFLVEVVGCAWDSLWHHSIIGKIVAIPSYLLMRFTVYFAPYSLYVTNEFLQRRYPTLGKSLGCSDVSLSDESNDVLTMKLLKIKEKSIGDSIVLCTTAAIDVRYKGQEYVIRAVSLLNKLGFKFEYHLIGGGNSDYLRNIAIKYNVSDKIIFLGTLPHEVIFEYLDRIDIYIQPSKLEGLPRALIEAMSRGCPSIGSNVGGISELLDKENLFSPGSIMGICRILETFDKEKMIRESRRNYQIARMYDRAKLEEIRKRFYQEYISQGIAND
jgi:glycosyltransferase involved in cell wall biosynthesis